MTDARIDWKHWSAYRSFSPIGLHVTAHEARAVQLKRIGEAVTVARWNACSLPANEPFSPRWVQAVGHLLEASSFRGRRVVVNVPSESLRTAVVRPDAGVDLDTPAGLAATAGKLGWDLDATIVDVLAPRRGAASDSAPHEVILMGAARAGVDALLRALAALDVHVLALEPVATAVWRWLRQSRRATAGEPVMWVRLEPDVTFIMAGDCRGLFFLKVVTVGTRKVLSEVADRLGVSLEQAELLCRRQEAPSPETTQDGELEASLDEDIRLAITDSQAAVARVLGRELELCLRYYAVTYRGRRIEEIAVSTSGSQAHGLIRCLADVLRRPVGWADRGEAELQADPRQHPLDTGHDRGAWAVAVGLALRGWRGAASKRAPALSGA